MPIEVVVILEAALGVLGISKRVGVLGRGEVSKGEIVWV